jgi:hypothetical protein
MLKPEVDPKITRECLKPSLNFFKRSSVPCIGNSDVIFTTSRFPLSDPEFELKVGRSSHFIQLATIFELPNENGFPSSVTGDDCFLNEL